MENKQYEMKNNTITLFSTKIKNSSKAPDLFGNLKLDNRPYKVAVWNSRKEKNKMTGNLTIEGSFEKVGKIEIVKSTKDMLPILTAKIKAGDPDLESSVEAEAILVITAGKKSQYFKGDVKLISQPLVPENNSNSNLNDSDVGF